MMAGLVYLVGCFGVTVFFNVPMNEGLRDGNVIGHHARLLAPDLCSPLDLLELCPDRFACAVSAALLLFGLLWMIQIQPRFKDGRDARLERRTVCLFLRGQHLRLPLGGLSPLP
jgi:hypothetical protein